MDLDERKYKILQAIIDDYITTAMPVGSRTISRKQGMGLSFLPEYIVRPALAAGRLARLNVPDCTVEMHRQLFYHRDKWLTPQMKAFIELVHQPAPGTASK